MTDSTVFRTAVTTSATQPAEEVLPKGSNQARVETTMEVPYSEYEREHAHPYSVDHFKLGDRWNDPEGGFPKEIAVIEEYFSHKISSGELANTLEAIQEEYKKMEKMTNLSKFERPLVKIETLAAYVEFLMKTDKIKFNLKRYGNS